MATVFRPAVVTRIERLDHYRSNLAAPVVGASIALLLAVAAAPFQPVDAPNPRGAVTPVSLLTWVQNPLTLRQPSQAPFFLTEQPNPRGSVSSAHLRTVESTSLGLRTAGGIIGAAPFSLGDQPNPRRAPFPSSLLTWIQAGQPAAIQPPVTHHFQQWTQDRSVAIRSQGAQGLLQSTLGISPKPFATTDWANPRGPQFSVSLRTWVLSPQIAPPGTQPPVTHHFQQWSVNPGVAIRAQSSLSWAPLPYFTQTPAVPVDQPNPRGKPFPTELRTWAANLLQGTLKPADAQPFSQTDWPVPKGAAFAADLRGYALAPPLVSYAPVAVPAHQCDWPNPRGYEPNFNRGWTQTPNPSLIPQPYTRTTNCVLYFPLRLWAITSSVGIVPSGDTSNLKSILPHSSVPVVQSDGTMAPVWYRAISYMANIQLGGPSAPTVPDVVASVTATQTQAASAAATASGLTQQVANNAESLQSVVEVAQDNSLSGADQIPPVQRSNQVES